MGLKKNRRNAKILPNQTFFGSDDLSYTGPNTSSIVPSCGLHARVARHAKVHLIFRTCRKNYFTLFRKKKQTHFASEELLKQPLCAVFFYALILFPTLSWLISIPRQIPYICVYKALLYKSGADCPSTDSANWGLFTPGPWPSLFPKTGNVSWIRLF